MTHADRRARAARAHTEMHAASCNIYICIYIHIYICICICIYICICIHIYIFCSRGLPTGVPTRSARGAYVAWPSPPL